MGYYRIALIAPVQYCADDPVWRCFEDLRRAGHTVELIDPRRFPEILDENHGVRREALSAFEQRFHPDYLGTGEEGAEEIIRGLMRADNMGTAEPTPRFVVFGFVGPNNFGDELIFSLICDELERRFPGAHIQLIGHNPHATLATHGVVATTCDDKLGIDIMLRGARCLVYMAGIIFDDPFANTAGPVDLFLNPLSEIAGQAAFTLMASMYEVPSVYLGIGAGPLENPDAQRLLRLEGRAGALYLPRDEQTAQLLVKAGVPAEQVRTKADLAFSLDPKSLVAAPQPSCDEELPERGSYVVVSLRQHRMVPSGFVDTVARALTRICEANDLAVVLADLSPTDEKIHDAVAARMSLGSKVVRVRAQSRPRATARLISRARAVIAMRLHCSIVANVCGVASIGLNYNEKVEAFYELTGRPDMLLPMTADAEQIVRAFHALDNNGKADLKRISTAVQQGRAKALEAFDELERLVRSMPAQDCPPRIFYPRRTSIEESELLLSRAEIAQEREKREAAERELERTKSSTAWHVGRAITALPRALKRRATE